MSRPARVPASGGDLLAGQVGLGDDPARVVQQAVRGPLEHRCAAIRRHAGAASSAYSRPSPASSSISRATAGKRRCSRRPGSGSAPSRRGRRGSPRSPSRRRQRRGGWRPGTRRTTRACGAGSGDRRSPGRRPGTRARTPRRRSAARRRRRCVPPRACQPALPISTRRSSRKQICLEELERLARDVAGSSASPRDQRARATARAASSALS